jgi:hypothetical protein
MSFLINVFSPLLGFLFFKKGKGWKWQFYRGFLDLAPFFALFGWAIDIQLKVNSVVAQEENNPNVMPSDLSWYKKYFATVVGVEFGLA